MELIDLTKVDTNVAVRVLIHYSAYITNSTQGSCYVPKGSVLPQSICSWGNSCVRTLHDGGIPHAGSYTSWLYRFNSLGKIIFSHIGLSSNLFIPASSRTHLPMPASVLYFELLPSIWQCVHLVVSSWYSVVELLNLISLHISCVFYLRWLAT